MPTTHIGRRNRDGVVGQLIPEALAIVVRDASGKPVKDAVVVFETDPEGAGEFAPGGQAYASVNTDSQGIARVQLRPTQEGTFTVRVTAEGHTHGLFEVVARRNAGAIAPGGGTHIEIRRRNLGWPVAAMVIAAMVVGGALWLFGGRGSSSGPTQPPVVIHQGGGGGSTVDHTARADAAAARASVEAAKQELALALDTGLAENSAHDQGYARESHAEGHGFKPRPTLRQALATARQVREHLTGRRGDQKPAICDDDPNYPACRE